MKVIVTTTVNPPTEALIRFSAMDEWKLVVVGDVHTNPEPFKDINCLFISFDEQVKYDPLLSDIIGPNCIQRKNFGFIWAVKELNADIIATVDDDNTPELGWGRHLMIGREISVKQYKTALPIFDPLCGTNHFEIYHRGFPMELVQYRETKPEGSFVTLEASVQADLWNGDPDVDAVCQMIMTPRCKFYFDYFTANKPSPFNSRNTFLVKDVIPHYFMFPGIGRWDDIIASYYVQALGYNVVYGQASVTQKRGERDLNEDFERELWGYRNTRRLVRELKEDPDNLFRIISERSGNAFRQYQTHFKM